MPEEPETIVTTIEVNKELFLKFKALCVLNNTKISAEIEKLIKRRVDELTKASEQIEKAKEIAQTRVPWKLEK
jgi:hypothetical protein